MMFTSVLTDTGRADPSANKKKAVPTCGVKKSSGSLVMSFRAWEPQWARTCTGASSTEVLVTGPPGVIRTVPLLIGPAQGACEDDAAGSPTANVLVVPSRIVAMGTRLVYELGEC